MSDLTPATDDVLQEEQAPQRMTPIPVVVEGPARTQELPSKTVVVAQQFLDSTGGIIQPQRILGEDPRRRIARLVATDQALRVGTSQKQVMGPDTCAIWPVGVVVEITGTSEIWVAADTATTRVSVISEQWAD